jgi:hypothetical protein
VSDENSGNSQPAQAKTPLRFSWLRAAAGNFSAMQTQNLELRLAQLPPPFGIGLLHLEDCGRLDVHALQPTHAGNQSDATCA